MFSYSKGPLLIVAVYLLNAIMVDADVLSEIKTVLSASEEHGKVLRYFEMSEDLSQHLPTSSESGPVSYTFFAPQNWAFVRAIPQDIADPFFVDADLRRTILLRHFVRRPLTIDELSKTSQLVMADGKTLPLEVDPSTKELLIDGAVIQPKAIQLGANMGVIYLVDRVFSTSEEISKSIRKHPSSHTPWFPAPPTVLAQAPVEVEDQTVVVDLVAEFLKNQEDGKK